MEEAVAERKKKCGMFHCFTTKASKFMTRICYQIIVKTPGDCNFCSVPKFQNLQASTKKMCYDTTEAKYNKGVKNCKFCR